MRRFNIQWTDSKGLTLVEVMMTLLIFGVVLGVVTNVFFTTQGLYGRTSQRASQQMSARAGLGIMVEEVRRAGADPELVGIVGLVRATQDSIHVRSELNDVAGIQLDEPSEDVLYFYDTGQNAIMRDNGTGAQMMVPDVTNLALTYFDVDNQLLGPLPLTPQLAARVRSVGITITTDTRAGGEMTITTRVGMRNL
ncbi:MAG: prepilin-type N-terminal cleavage/methylation domain-containing protein [Candidatus Krumholzibacteria bacterium]|nr:prepilin-type N-terminal cleavage/methylation domain-containing protein [Candidatus Krumholzibacteria bacterium]